MTDKTTTDQEKADSIRKRFGVVAIPVAMLIKEAIEDGLIIRFSIEIKNGEPDLSCEISKEVKL